MIGTEFKIVDGYVVTGKFLGSGAFGSVYRGYKENDPKQICAVKVLPMIEATNNKNFMKTIKREIEILGKIKSQYIVQMYHAARTARNFYIFLEYCNGGNLRELMKQKGGYLSEQDALTYFKQIVEGFKAIYQENVMHRDIKPANILLHNGIAKISDFGFARIVDDMEGQDRFTLLGTPLYMTPQILEQSKFNSKCDIWSLGIMFYEMLYGHTPWTANSQLSLLDQIKKKPLVFPEQPKRQQIIKELISQMLIIDEEKRISWYDIFEHQLIKSNSQELKNKLNLIIDSVQDTLEQSVQVNRFYIDNNLVLEQGKQQQELFEVKESDEANTPADKDLGQQTFEDLKGLTYNDIMEVQTKKLQEQITNNKIDAYLTLQRNIGIFVNLSTNYIFDLYKEQLISIPTHLFYRILFILQKKQMIIFEDLTNIMASKIQINNGFTDQDWKLYKKNKQYFTTLKAIKTDKYYIKPYYEEIAKRTQTYLNNQIAQNKLNEQEQQDLNEFLSIMANGLIQDLAFNSVYEKTLKITQRLMYEQLCQQKKLTENKNFLLALRYLVLCLSPEMYFRQQKEFPDFNKFYEHYNNSEMEQLLEELHKEFSSF
ncbi:unnamed protein product (macronuclear) [Paramecium tetraurelia]|uniref:Protein kinase domain-containing protein n=1 Tax=Paramecium tetraurelia TaxID=5888 RepID=A0BT56_PARTE|nr:uncharacterized protein GSPATT00031955001 [Paramecium tetraurelia]CAK61723.1 unnamed protein product [Paramecium tetraurelia]|eukprot:XP_001429121.1 hypothetical protein (macronuclear) [Paramecium tetraurelia strain d4-2]